MERWSRVEVRVMTSTKQHDSLELGARSGKAVERAWVSVALIPAFLLISVLLTSLLYDWLGYKPENADAPLWVDLLTAAVAMAIFLVPCVTAVLYGRQASRVGDRRALIPLGIGALAGLSLTVLTVVSTLGPF
jgi:hypothetical protein